MKLQVEIRAVLNDQDPAYRQITTIGLEKAVEDFKKKLAGQGVESVDVVISEVK